MRQISLRQRALEALSRREFSRLELGRKLAPYADTDDTLQRLLDALESEKLLSNARFAESLAHRRAARFGARRVAFELDQHGLDPLISAAHVEALKRTEVERCEAVWRKKFNQAPNDLAERARQSRFLAGRGFEPAAIAIVLKKVP